MHLKIGRIFFGVSIYYFGMYHASNQSGIWNDLTCPEVHEGPLCVCFGKIPILSYTFYFQLVFMETHPSLASIRV